MSDRCGALPDLGEEKALEFYQQALAVLAPHRVKGFYGAIVHEEEGEVSIFLYCADPRDPSLRLVMTRADFARFAAALSGLAAGLAQTTT